MAKKPTQLALMSNTTLGLLAFVGILALVALIGQRHPFRFDLTENKRYSISEQSQKIVRGLDHDIHIKAFFQETDSKRGETRDLLETYRYYSKKIEYQFIDPDREPSLAKRYQIRAYGSLVLEGFGKTQTVAVADEENVTNAILKLTQKQEKIVFFLTGHGERDVGDFDKDGFSTAKEAIERENFKVKTLNLLVEPSVPENAALVVLADPKKPLLAKEIESLKQYLNQGGSVMVMLEPFADGGLRNVLTSYGFSLSSDIVVDTMSRVFGADYFMPVITEYGFHKITDGFKIACFFPTARSVFPTQESPDGVNLAELALTSAYSWSETEFSLGQPGTPEFDELKDRKGPITVAMVATIATQQTENTKTDKGKTEPGSVETSNPRGQARLVVFGDSDFVSNSYFGLQGNSDFFLNTINFLGQQENLITIERPDPKSAPLTLSKSQGQLLFWVGLILMPALVLASGLTVFRLRRKHR